MTNFERDRRKVLTAGGAALSFALAGCIGPFADGRGMPGTVDPVEREDESGGMSDGGSGDGDGDETGSGGGSGDGMAEVDEWLTDTPNYDGTVEDFTGQDEVRLQNGDAEAIGAEGTFVFEPPAIEVDPGTTVTWEWIGETAHSVTNEGGAFNSEILSGEGTTFEHTFDEEGTSLYFCQPHRSLGQKGAVVVGGGGGGGSSDGGDGGGGGGGDSASRVDTYLTDGEANLYDGSIADLTGQGEVTIDVGGGSDGLAFDPAAFRIDAGTTVVWEWTGEGGGHNVVPADDGDFDFGDDEIVIEAGNTVEETFEESGVGLYLCQPHVSLGMIGGFIVE